MNKLIVAFLALIIAGGAFAGDGGKKKKKLEKGIYAEFNTNRGKILVVLEHEKAPMTVANFVGLAEGKFKVDSIEYNEPFYDGILFHRVIADFMIQGGDPQGNGTGGPKHSFQDEFHPDLKHSGPGILSMANSGPNTNGSQFFITHKETPWLDNKHSVFGHVVEGQDVVNAIQQGDTMKTVKIIRVGRPAKKWKATEVFADAQEKIKAEEKRRKEYVAKVESMSTEEFNAFFLKEIQKDYPEAKQTESGLVYVLEDTGSDPHANPGDDLSVHCTGTFRYDDKKFFSTYDGDEPMKFKYKVQRMVPGFEEGLAMMGAGGKGKFFLPYHLAYGAQGRQGAIPSFSDLIFEIEIVEHSPSSGEHEGHDHDGHDHNHNH